MAVEIGTLVLRGQFGPTQVSEPENQGIKKAELDMFRRTILREVEDMMAEADRRARER